MIISSQFIRSQAARAGFSLCGIARARTLDERGEALDRWLDAGMESGMEYMRRNRDKRLDPRAMVDGARTVVVCAVNYKNAAWRQTAVPRISSHSYMPDYHGVIKEMLGQVLAAVRAEYPDVNGRCFCDTAPVLEKAWAVEAGLGWVGKNSLLLTPGFGSFVLLGEVILDAECDAHDAPFAADRCGSCTRCVDACPNGAIVSPRVVDTRRCISRLTLEHMRTPAGAASQRAVTPLCPDGGSHPNRARAISAQAPKSTPPPPGLHGWLAGCDECQSCCPYNQRTPLCTDPRLAPVIAPATATPEFWRTLTEERFDRLFSVTPLARRGYGALKELIDRD
jgi:epoxyqueuosine reductase